MWPEFSKPILLSNGYSWSAGFDSYNQRTDEVYYMVTLHAAGRDPISFMVCVDYAWATDNMSEEEIATGLRKLIAEVAATGKTNTRYHSNGPGRGGVFV